MLRFVTVSDRLDHKHTKKHDKDPKNYKKASLLFIVFYFKIFLFYRSFFSNCISILRMLLEIQIKYIQVILCVSSLTIQKHCLVL